ncbi:MAG: ribbon-helix-helix protein, CopG family [Angustibacter sp.]
MAMTLRLDPQLDQALSDVASRLGKSKQQIAVTAIREYTDQQQQFRRRALERIVAEDAELLRRLAE